MEGYFEQVVDTLTGAGYRWYETANFCLDRAIVRAGETSGRGTTSRTGWGATTSGSASVRSRRSRESAAGTCRGSAATSRALAGGEPPPRELEVARRATRGHASG